MGTGLRNAAPRRWMFYLDETCFSFVWKDTGQFFTPLEVRSGALFNDHGGRTEVSGHCRFCLS